MTWRDPQRETSQQPVMQGSCVITTYHMILQFKSSHSDKTPRKIPTYRLQQQWQAGLSIQKTQYSLKPVYAGQISWGKMDFVALRFYKI